MLHWRSRSHSLSRNWWALVRALLANNKSGRAMILRWIMRCSSCMEIWVLIEKHRIRMPSRRLYPSISITKKKRQRFKRRKNWTAAPLTIHFNPTASKTKTSQFLLMGTITTSLNLMEHRRLIQTNWRNHKRTLSITKDSKTHLITRATGKCPSQASNRCPS